MPANVPTWYSVRSMPALAWLANYEPEMRAVIAGLITRAYLLRPVPSAAASPLNADW